jgi:hypothetical protein
MCGVEESKAPELREGNVAAGKLHFERSTVMGCAKQDGLMLQERSALTVLEDLFDDVAGLIHLIPHADKPRPLTSGGVGPEMLGEALAR